MRTTEITAIIPNYGDVSGYGKKGIAFGNALDYTANLLIVPTVHRPQKTSRAVALCVATRLVLSILRSHT